MRFKPSLTPARLVRRYQRFLADVVLTDGTPLTVHCPNTGAMLGCQAPGSKVWLSLSGNPGRKYAHTWELVETLPGVQVGINTGRSNALVAEALEAGVIGPLAGYPERRREVAVADGRLDFLLSGHTDRPDCYLEVKNVTAAAAAGTALFPDAQSARATRHVKALLAERAAGRRAAVIFCVQRDDVTAVRPAAEIDPAFSRSLDAAVAAGVEVYAYGAEVGPDEIRLVRRLEVLSAL